MLTHVLASLVTMAMGMLATAVNVVLVVVAVIGRLVLMLVKRQSDHRAKSGSRRGFRLRPRAWRAIALGGLIGDPVAAKK